MTAVGTRASELGRPVWVERALLMLRRRRLALIWMLPVLAIAATVGFTGMAGSPQRIDDEGTYTAQAWAITHLGELAHYTFWYDHPPLGWIQIAGYTQLTGAFARYDIAVLAAREGMIVAALISAALIWCIGRRLGFSRGAAAAAALVFSVSPLALQFHRTVYLDNVATPWLLAAIVLVLNRRNQLAAFAGAAVAFGIAVLSKETYLLALPLLIWLAVRGAHRDTRRYTLSVAGSILVLIGGSYLLLAAVKGELVPSGGRVSLVDGVMFQLSSRDGSGSVLDFDSLIRQVLGMWWSLDPVLIVAALAAAVVAVFDRRLRPFAVMLLGASVFILRPGGYLPVPYVIMLLPLASLVVAGVADAAVKRVRAHGAPRLRRAGGVVAVVAAAVAVAVAVPLWTIQLRGFLLADLDAPVRDAESWVEENVARDQRLVVDDAMWVDFIRAGWDRDDVVWYYKVDTDPAVEKQSPNGWRDTDYVITTDSMRTFPDAFPQVQQALDNSTVVASFGSGTRRVDVRQVHPAGADAARDARDLAATTAGTAGAQLVADPDLTVSRADRDLLTGGRVDLRIAIALGTAVAQGGVAVAGFPVVDGEADGVRRQVALERIGGEPAVVDGEASTAAQRLLASLEGSTAPESTRVEGDALVLEYPIPSGTA